MPNFALHVLLASRVAGEWRARPRQAPFDPAEPGCLNAFLHGCIGPDMGMYPGGEPLISELVHRVRTGRLARALLARARTAPERAFAWGWVTHLLADATVHPLVDAAAAASLGRTDVRGDHEHGLAHVRVEIGLDATYLARHASLSSVRLTRALDARAIRWFSDAVHDTYGITFSDDAVARSHRAVLRFHRYVLALASFAAHRWRERPRGPFDLAALYPVLGTARWAALRAGVRSAGAALLDPLPPAPSLRAAVDGVLRLFPRIVQMYEATRLAALRDVDLETGNLEDPTRPTNAAVATLRALARRGLIVAGHPALDAAA